MSDPNYSCTPPGGYYYDADDYRRMEVESVKCVCGAIVPKDDAHRDDDDTTWLCGDCYEAIEKMKEGVIS
jgi:hypothetical protein